VLSHGEGFAVSDRSFKDEKGTAAWIIEAATANTQLISQWHTPGQTEDHSSFRSELAGIVGVLYTLTFWPPASERPYFRLACHGLSVVSRLSSNHPIEPTEPHSDLLKSVRALIVTSKYHIDLQFVRGHQDTGCPMALTHDAWLNVEADLLAKAKTAQLHQGPQYFKLPGNPWSCYMALNVLLNNSIYPSGITLTDKKHCTTGKNGNSYYLNSCKRWIGFHWAKQCEVYLWHEEGGQQNTLRDTLHTARIC